MAANLTSNTSHNSRGAPRRTVNRRRNDGSAPPARAAEAGPAEVMLIMKPIRGHGGAHHLSRRGSKAKSVGLATLIFAN